jgi:thiosulfate/3-mercaptopyruvate sulfurtransferase
MNLLVNMKWVKDHLKDPTVVLIDCRFTLGHPSAGRTAYLEEHIPGAFYLDLEADLSGAIGEHGGRHPLPDPYTLAEALSAIGIDEGIHVVAYDDQGGAMAARLWWLLTYLGHPHTCVMNGTFRMWKEQGYPVTKKIPLPKPRTFTPSPQPHLLAEMEEVKQKLGHPETILVDSREPKRYRGEEEPIDRIAGHIPGAKNFFWKGVLREEGEWKTPDELRKHFANLPQDKEIIVYCGSGVTATPNILALKEAGYSNVKLYAGSWSDWISHEDNPVAVWEEN